MHYKLPLHSSHQTRSLILLQPLSSCLLSPFLLICFDFFPFVLNSFLYLQFKRLLSHWPDYNKKGLKITIVCDLMEDKHAQALPL